MKHIITAIKQHDDLMAHNGALQREIEADENLIDALKKKCKAQQDLIDTQQERIKGLEDRVNAITPICFAMSSQRAPVGVPEPEVIAHGITAQMTRQIHDAVKEHIELIGCANSKLPQSPFYRYISLDVNIKANGAREYVVGMNLCPLSPFESRVIKIRDFR